MSVSMSRRLAGVVVLMTGSWVLAQPPVGQDAGSQPRFRGGANLVRVDAYVTAGGAPVVDLTVDDFEVLEDNVPQRVESFELIEPRGPAPVSALREPNTVAESRDMARAPEARVFVIFMDVWHVQLSGSYRAQRPIADLLGRVIGQDDLVGVMTPDMAARTLTLARRPTVIEGIFRDHWYWGERGQINTPDPREDELRRCYPDAGDTQGLARELIRRRRESRTLTALEDLILHLEGIREERKFVLLLTEGWALGGPQAFLARALRTAGGGPTVPPPPGIGVDPQGRLRTDPRLSGDYGSCERERSMLAYSDHTTEFLNLLRRANRANVSFYPLDPRGLVAFDEPIGPDRPYGPAEDMSRLRDRQDALRSLADETDGYALLNTNDTSGAVARMVQDTGAYYLLGYYSTNTKLDGRYRRLTVRVKRPGADVRARPGYLAPSEAELASARVDALMNGAPAGHTTIPPTVSAALARLSPVRGTVPVRLQAAAAPERIWITGELDSDTARAEDWQKGGHVRARFEHERGEAPAFEADVTLAAGQRVFSVAAPAGVTLAPGRYVVRVQLTPLAGSIPLQGVADVNVPAPARLLGETGLAARRGPSTGLAYVPTADARFRRTERLRFEVPRGEGESDISARLLGRDGQPLTVALALGERREPDTGQRLIVADVTLAPLAQGEYVLEVAAVRGDTRDTATYAFRLVP